MLICIVLKCEWFIVLTTKGRELDQASVELIFSSSQQNVLIVDNKSIYGLYIMNLRR